MSKIIHKININVDTGVCKVDPPIDIYQGDKGSHVLLMQLFDNNGNFVEINPGVINSIAFYCNGRLIESSGVKVENAYRGRLSYVVSESVVDKFGRYTVYLTRKINDKVVSSFSFVVNVILSHNYNPKTDEILLTQKEYDELMKIVKDNPLVMDHLKDLVVHVTQEDHDVINYYKLIKSDIEEMLQTYDISTEIIDGKEVTKKISEWIQQLLDNDDILNSNISNVRTSVNILDSRLSHDEEMISYHSGRLDTQYRMIEDNKLSINDLSIKEDTDIESLDNKIDQSVSDLNSSIDNLSTEVSQMSNKVDSANDKADQAVSEVSELGTEVSQLSGDISGITEDISHIESDVSDLQQNKSKKIDDLSVSSNGNIKIDYADNTELETSVNIVANLPTGTSGADMTYSVDDLGNYLYGEVSSVSDDLSVEVINRESADNELQSQIDAITVSSDVVDVVGTYQELLDYDTSGLGDNSIIKVLQDSTHNDSMSYYKWIKSSSQWDHVGSEGPFYTKSESDNKFQEKLVSGTNIKTINNESILGSGNLDIEGGGGASDYDDLTNKPSINGETLTGNKTSADLGLQDRTIVTGTDNKNYYVQFGMQSGKPALILTEVQTNE